MSGAEQGSTIGGNTAAGLNLISANHWGVRLDAGGATGNLVEGNYIGTDITGLSPVGNETIGVITSGSVLLGSASNNTIGGITADLGNRIWFQRDGVSIQSGTGNSILSNSIFQNARIGIDLVAAGRPPTGITPNQSGGLASGPNHLQNIPY